jgi:thiosulfate/3-mercaptopyruvate sulfurtransferase
MLSQVEQKGYDHPNVLVTTEWVQANLDNPKVRIAEVDYDPSSNYAQGHIPGSVLFDWKKDLNEPLTRDILSKAQLEELLGRNGITDDTEIVLYGDFNNWFAAYAFWDLQYYGVTKTKLMNGGRKKWLLEDRPLTKDVPSHQPTSARSTHIKNSSVGKHEN